MTAPRIPDLVRFATSVRVRLGPDQGFLFDERSGRVYSLNASAALAAARIQAEAPLGVVAAAVVDAFEVDAATVRRDLTRFVSELIAEGLAQAGSAP
jgi:coenzyme PQQ synthesis protein D (PqqD)